MINKETRILIAKAISNARESFEETFEKEGIDCVKCGKKKTLKEFFCVPLGLCEECDIKECKEFLK